MTTSPRCIFLPSSAILSRYTYTEEKSFFASSGCRFSTSSYMLAAASPNGRGVPDVLAMSVARPMSYMEWDTIINDRHWETHLQHQSGCKPTLIIALTWGWFFWKRSFHWVVHGRWPTAACRTVDHTGKHDRIKSESLAQKHPFCYYDLLHTEDEVVTNLCC